MLAESRRHCKDARVAETAPLVFSWRFLRNTSAIQKSRFDPQNGPFATPWQGGVFSHLRRIVFLRNELGFEEDKHQFSATLQVGISVTPRLCQKFFRKGFSCTCPIVVSMSTRSPCRLPGSCVSICAAPPQPLPGRQGVEDLAVIDIITWLCSRRGKREVSKCHGFLS